MRRHQKSQNSHSSRRGERPSLKPSGTMNQPQQNTSPKKGPSYQQDLEYFTNHHFSRSFNSLILDDVEHQCKNKKLINKSPPFNVKLDSYIRDTIDDTIDANFDDTESDFFSYDDLGLDLLSDHGVGVQTEDEDCGEQDIAKGTPQSHVACSGSEAEPTPTDSPSRTASLLYKTKKPLLKRSSKYFNLSIDSSFVPGQPSALSRKESKFTPSPSGEKGTHFNKFKRPHKLVSQSPSPNSGNKNKLVVGVFSPSKVDKTSRLFKSSTNIRMKTPVKLGLLSSASPPTKTEFNIKRLGKSPNLRFMSSSSLLASNTLNDHALRWYDESPLRPKKKVSLHFNIYHEEEDQGSSITSETISECNPLSTSGSSVSDLNKENQCPQPVSSARKASYKLVKPLQIAFESAGLRKKSSVPKMPNKDPPETPMKRQPLVIINSEKSSLSDCNESFLNQDHSIEVGRNASGSYLSSNDSNSSFFKLPSVAKSDSDMKLDFTEPLDLELDPIPETPTKLSSRGKNLNFIVESMGNKAPMRLGGVAKADLCTPILHLPTDSLISSQTTLSLSDPFGEAHSNEHTITEPTGSFDNKRDPLLPESKTIDLKDFSDERLVEKFGAANIKYIGSGQFSVAFECNFRGQKFAIKRNRRPISSYHEKKSLIREIEALRALTSFHDGEVEVAEGKENLVFFVETWTSHNFYYIMTEYCEGGTLSEFLDDYRNYKLDEFRVWKILIEIVSGLGYINLKNYLHLDLKPANIFITFDGSLKIGDFGLSAKLPILEEDFDLEGDRNYIAPELINDKIYTPYADIFSVGLIILEIATNIILPGNGTPWKKLRSGDLSDAGKLSSDNISDFLNHRNFSSVTSYNLPLQSIGIPAVSQSLSTAYPPDNIGSRSVPEQTRNSYSNRTSASVFDKNQEDNLIDSVRELIPKGAPEFLLDNSHRLDDLVSLMLKPNPFERPTANDVLTRKECVQIESRRKAGATIFEGEFGPNED